MGIRSLRRLPAPALRSRGRPSEATDLADSPGHVGIRRELEQRLREIVDVDVANERAFQDQRRRIEALGGVEAVRAWGDFGYTPLTTD